MFWCCCLVVCALICCCVGFWLVVIVGFGWFVGLLWRCVVLVCFGFDVGCFCVCWYGCFCFGLVGYWLDYVALLVVVSCLL